MAATRRIDLSEIPERHPAAVFHDYWRTFCEGQKVLSRERFNPFDLPQVIPWMMILEKHVHHGMTDYRHRLCGTGCVELLGFDPTGRLMTEIMPTHAALRRQIEFAEVERGGKPVFRQIELPIPGREFISVFSGLFPVARRSHAVRELFVVMAEKSECAHGIRA